MERSNNSDDDALIEAMFRGYVGTREIFQVGTTENDLPILVLVNDHVQAPRRLAHLGKWLVVSPQSWADARNGQASLPEEFRGQIQQSWQRLARHDDTTTLVEHLELRNVRCFEHVDISFCAGMNVLIGRNGAGKTTVLDALAKGLSSLVNAHVPRSNPDRDFILPEDIRMVPANKHGLPTFERQVPAHVDVVTRIYGKQLGETYSAENDQGLSLTLDDDRMVSWRVIDFLRWAVDDGFDITLPLFAYYDPRRHWKRPEDLPEKTRDAVSRWSGYDDCLHPSAHPRKMRDWFRRMELLALQSNHVPAILEASKRAMLTCLDGFDVVRYDAHLDDLAARSSKTGLFLGFDQLSDGQRNMLGVVADLAYRAATLNPHLGAEAPAQTPGIVLVDELDLHLHPAWQRRIVGDLQKAFPLLQFIVTTHSPQILSSVADEAVLVLEDNQFFRPAAPTRGRDTNSILAEVLGTNMRPAETASRIAEATRLLDDHQYDEARIRLDELAIELTERDPDIWRLRNMLDIVKDFDEADTEGA